MQGHPHGPDHAHPHSNGDPSAPLGRALVAVPDRGLAASLSSALLAAGLLPIAATKQEVFIWVHADQFVVLVIHTRLGSPQPLEEVRRSSNAPILGIGPLATNSRPLPAGLAPNDQVPDDLDPSLLTTHCLALLAGRRSVPPPDETELVSWGPLCIDVPRREAFWNDAPLPLTPTQFHILVILIRAQGALVPGPELSRQLWSLAIPHDRDRLYAHIRRIRKHIEPDPSHAVFLLSIRGEGFRLAAPPRRPAPPESSPSPS